MVAFVTSFTRSHQWFQMWLVASITHNTFNVTLHYRCNLVYDTDNEKHDCICECVTDTCPKHTAEN